MKWQVFKVLHIRQRRKVIHKSWHINMVIPKTATAYCLERISRLLCREREPRQSPVDSLIWRDAARSLRRRRLSCLTHRTEFYRDCTERCWEIMACPPCLLNITLTDGRYNRVGSDPKLRKGPLEGICERIRGSSTWCSPRASNSAVHTSETEKKPYISWAFGRVHRCFASVAGQNLVPRLSKHGLSSANRA